MVRGAVAEFVESHVLAPAVQRATLVLSSTSAMSRPSNVPALMVISECFELAGRVADASISSVLDKLSVSAVTSQSVNAAVTDKRVEVAAALVARDEVSRSVVDVVVASAIASTPSRRRHRHDHHTQSSHNKRDVHQDHATIAKVIAERVYATDILPAASRRVESVKHKRHRLPPSEIPAKDRGGRQHTKQTAVKAEAAPPPLPAPTPPPSSISADSLRHIAKSLVSSAAIAAIHLVLDATAPKAPECVTDTEADSGDGVQAASVSSIAVVAVEAVTVGEGEVSAAPSPVPTPAVVSKPSPRRKRHTAKATARTIEDPPAASPQPPPPSHLPPIRLPSSPRSGIDHVQLTPRTARTAAAAIASPRESTAVSPPRPATLLPPVVTTPRSSSSHASLAAIYHPSAPRPPPTSSSKPPRHSRPPSEQPAESSLTDKSRSHKERRHRDKDKAKTPSGYCQRCALDGRACKLRDCLKHQPPLRLPPARRAQPAEL